MACNVKAKFIQNKRTCYLPDEVYRPAHHEVILFLQVLIGTFPKKHQPILNGVAAFGLLLANH